MSRLLLALLLLASPAEACDAPTIEVAFSPGGGATAAVERAIREAGRSVRVAAYGFTSRPIAQALVEAHARGIDVRAVLDKSNARGRRSAAPLLVAAGIPVRIDSRHAIMHDKFVVVDGATVETGSFNFTRAAEVGNAENVIVLRGYPGVASRYEGRWDKLWAESSDFGTATP